MRRSTVALVVVALTVGGWVRPAIAQDARGIALVHSRLVVESFDKLERRQVKLRETWALVEAGNGALADAQRQGADLASLETQEEQLQELEGQLLMQILEVQRARRDLLTNRAVMEAAGGSPSAESAETGILNGDWELTVQPGLTGRMYLVQQGTLVNGTYELSGGWTGSLRGTLVANKVRLERIDSQLGFAAIFYGELNVAAEPNVIQGRWEATQLATGMPSAGGWRAERED